MIERVDEKINELLDMACKEGCKTVTGMDAVLIQFILKQYEQCQNELWKAKQEIKSKDDEIAELKNKLEYIRGVFDQWEHSCKSNKKWYNPFG